MIFVTLGTQDKPFKRLVEAVNKYSLNHPEEDIIVQLGCTTYQSDTMKLFDYIPSDKMEHYFSNADIIITHGGVGSILEAIKKNKKVIAVPRLKKFGEHVNDHQTQIVSVFADMNYIIACNDLKLLEEKIDDAKQFFPNRLHSNNEHFVSELKKIVDSLLNNEQM